MAGAGCILFDSQGQWIVGATGNLGITTSATIKLWGAFQVLKLAWDNGYCHVIFEVDSQLVIQILTNINPLIVTMES